MNVFKVHVNGRSWLIQMLGRLIPHLILHCSTGTSPCCPKMWQEMLKTCVVFMCWKKGQWGGGKMWERERERDLVQLCVLNDLTGNVFYRFHSPNDSDFPLQSAPFLFPFPLVSAFISVLNFCFLFAPCCHFVHPFDGFSLLAGVRHCTPGVIHQFGFTRDVGFGHRWSIRVCFPAHS